MRRDRRRSAVAISPRSIFGSSLAAWYQFNRGITLGTPPEVAAWADQSGRANDLVQTTVASRPFTAADGVDFDGIDDNIAAPSSSTLDVVSALTVAIRVKPDV